MNEELLIKMGLDSSAMATGIRGVKGQLEEFGRSIKNAFSEVGTHIAGAFSVGGAVLMLEKALNAARDIKRVSEDLGVSPRFVQDLKNVGSVAGVSGEKLEKMMAYFTKKLEPGTDPEEAFYKWADAISKIEDPVTRVAMAMEAFGKGGEKMISIAGRGSDAMKALGDSFARLSDSELLRLDEAQAALDRMKNRATVGAGTVASGYEFLGELFNKGALYPGGLPYAWKEVQQAGMKADVEANVLEEARLQAEKDARIKLQANAMGPSTEDVFLKWAKERQKHLKEILDTETEILSRAKARLATRLTNAGERYAEVQGSISDLQRSQVGFSLEELARRRNYSGRYQLIYGGTGELGPPGAAEAQEVMRLRGFAKENAIRGNVGMASKQMNQANDIFDKLAQSNPFLIDPLEHLKRQAEKQTHALNALLHKAGGEGDPGILVRPEMGN